MPITTRIRSAFACRFYLIEPVLSVPANADIVNTLREFSHIATSDPA